MTKLHELAGLGQAIWLDYIHRSLITSGELQKWIDDGVRGITSNPSIFGKAIANSTDYDAALAQLAHAGHGPLAIYEALAIADIQATADLLLPTYRTSHGLDGYVSLEVNPGLAHDTAGTVAEAQRLRTAVARPNLLIKVPATVEGIPAIERLIGDGVSVNITLIFSIAQYEATARAYVRGLEQRAERGGELSGVASVASLFVSRVDAAVDPRLEALGQPNYMGKTAVANARLAYQLFKELFSGARWERLVSCGARVQRPLWASTSTKNPSYPDTLYVDSLIGPHTVNTVPPQTLEAFLKHGTVCETVETDLAEAREQLAALERLGIDLDAVMNELQDAGVASFSDAFESLLGSIREKAKRLGN